MPSSQIIFITTELGRRGSIQHVVTVSSHRQNYASLLAVEMTKTVTYSLLACNGIFLLVYSGWKDIRRQDD